MSVKSRFDFCTMCVVCFGAELVVSHTLAWQEIELLRLEGEMSTALGWRSQINLKRTIHLTLSAAIFISVDHVIFSIDIHSGVWREEKKMGISLCSHYFVIYERFSTC